MGLENCIRVLAKNLASVGLYNDFLCLLKCILGSIQIVSSLKLFYFNQIKTLFDEVSHIYNNKYWDFFVNITVTIKIQ